MWPFTKSAPSVPAGDIIAAFDPWTLCCAVGAENGSIGSRTGFDRWLSLSEENWIGNVRAKVPSASRNAIVSALRSYVAKNRALPYQAVLASEERKRGLAPACVIGRETITVNIPFEIQ